MTREAKLEAISRLLQDFKVGMTIAEYSNKILDAITMKTKPKRKPKGC